MKLIKIMGVLMLGVLMMAMVAGCDSSDETTTGEPTPNQPNGTQLQVEPDFIGSITKVNVSGTNDVLGTIMVEGTDTIQSSDKYDVTIDGKTEVLEQSGSVIDFDSLEAGNQVKVWFSGPIMESYPAQADAAKVIVVGTDEPVFGEDPAEGPQIVGGTPGSAGYTWDDERKGWHRTWDAESFISAADQPEWDKFIPESEISSELIVDESASGTEAELPVGESVIVRLVSNPSTGFQWELAEISDETVLKQTSHVFSMEETDPMLVGAPGEEYWVFEAIGAGSSTISMEYSRPWDGGEKAVEIFNLTVIVQ